MTQFAAPSILRGIERDDIASIRRVMNALMRRLAGVPSTTAAQMSDLEYNEANVVNRIHLATRGNGLLTAMVTRFASARYGNTNTVIRATANLNGLAVEAVQDPSSRPTMEFTMAEAFFNHQVQTDAFVYGAGGDLEYGDIEPDDDTEMKDSSRPSFSGMVCGRKRTVVGKWATTYTPSVKRAKLTHGENSDSESLSDSCEESDAVFDGGVEEDGRETSTIDAVVETKKIGDKKHAPVRNKGERCIYDGQDRESAKVGVKDVSKLYIEFRTERDHPTITGETVPGEPAKYTYRQPVDWNSKESIQKLNNHRYQVFRRNVGGRRKSRGQWTITEQDKLLEIVQGHLRTVEVGGRYSQINWSEVERQFNRFFNGTKTNSGEMTAETRYRVKDKNDVNREAVAKSRPLNNSRIALTRSAMAIQSVLKQFTSEAVKKMIKDAKARDEKAPADTDDSTSLSSPPSSTYGKNKGKGKGKARIDESNDNEQADKGTGKAPDKGNGDALESGDENLEKLLDDLDDDAVFEADTAQAIIQSNEEEFRKIRKNNSSKELSRDPK